MLLAEAAKSARYCLRSMPWIAANRRKEGAVPVSAAGKTCWPTDATTVELPNPLIYAIDAELGRNDFDVFALDGRRGLFVAALCAHALRPSR